MKKEDLLEIEEKIKHNEELISKNEKIITENAGKIDTIFEKLKKYSDKINKNSFALEIIKDNNKELNELTESLSIKEKSAKIKNIIILIETLTILGLAAIVIAHHWK